LFELNDTIIISDYDFDNEIYLNHTVTIVGIYDVECKLRQINEWNENLVFNDQLIVNNPLIFPGSFITSGYEDFKAINRDLHPNSDYIDISIYSQMTFILKDIVKPQVFSSISLKLDRFMEGLSWIHDFHLRRYEKLRDGSGYYYFSYFRRFRDFDDIRM
ncbi:MAG: hypothetical protein ACTSP4_15565, partial [Candidatus Hodarchaeales archaeon]